MMTQQTRRRLTARAVLARKRQDWEDASANARYRDENTSSTDAALLRGREAAYDYALMITEGYSLPSYHTLAVARRILASHRDQCGLTAAGAAPQSTAWYQAVGEEGALNDMLDGWEVRS